MRVIIDYKHHTKNTIRNNIQVVSMTDKNKKNDCVFILKDGESNGTYFSLKNIHSFEVIRD